VKKYLDLAYEYEAKNVLLVLGEYIWNSGGHSAGGAMENGVQNCRVLGDYAANLGVQMPWSWSRSIFRGQLVDTMVRFIDDCNTRAVRANIDVSHLCLAKVPAERVAAAQGKAIHVHISDCDGIRHGDLPPAWRVQFEPYLREIKALGTTAPCRSSSNTRRSGQDHEWVAGSVSRDGQADAGRGLRG